MKVINLFGGPGSGKSTTAAGLFYHMKMKGLNAELVAEYPKELFYSGVLEILTPYGQKQIFAEQAHRLERLLGKVDYAIVDCSLLLSYIYGKPDPTNQTFLKLVTETYKQFDNVNIFIDRPDTYQTSGRMEDLAQANEIDQRQLKVLHDLNEPYFRFKADKHLVDRILNTMGLGEFGEL